MRFRSSIFAVSLTCLGVGQVAHAQDAPTYLECKMDRGRGESSIIYKISTAKGDWFYWDSRSSTWYDICGYGGCTKKMTSTMFTYESNVVGSWSMRTINRLTGEYRYYDLSRSEPTIGKCTAIKSPEPKPLF